MIHPTCLIGEPPQDKRADQKHGIDRSKIKLGRRNIIREYVCIHAPTGRETSIGSDNFIMTHCVINHDCKIGDQCVLSSGVKLGGFCIVDDYANIGMNACVHQGVVIGSFSMVGMGAAVTKHVPPFCLLNPKYDRIAKINRVGMLRNGYSEEDVAAIFSAYTGKRDFNTLRVELQAVFNRFAAFVKDSPVSRKTFLFNAE